MKHHPTEEKPVSRTTLHITLEYGELAVVREMAKAEDMTLTAFVRRSAVQYARMQQEFHKAEAENMRLLQTKLTSIQVQQKILLLEIEKIKVAEVLHPLRETSEVTLNLLTLFVERWWAHTEAVPEELWDERVERAKRAMRKLNTFLDQYRGSVPRIIQELDDLRSHNRTRN